jgi:predicted type IV restriction endonuclease
VRQHVVHALVASGWPLSRMVLEHPVRVGQVDGRIDIACFDRNGRVALAVEVKAPQVRLDQSVADQVAKYDLALGCPWLMISNGLQNAVWRRAEDGVCRPHRAWPVSCG